MEQGLANELFGRTKGALRKVIDWRPTPDAAFILRAARATYGAPLALSRIVEKRRVGILAGTGATCIEPGEGPLDAALQTRLGHPCHMKIVPVDESSGPRA